MALMGLGYRSVTLVKTDEFARMDVADLKAKTEAQANGEQIMAIVATAGTTDAGLSTRCATSRYRGGASDLAAR
jgi:L-2,4-diaminobutyrate decarboxylase